MSLPIHGSSSTPPSSEQREILRRITRELAGSTAPLVTNEEEMRSMSLPTHGSSSTPLSTEQRATIRRLMEEMKDHRPTPTKRERIARMSLPREERRRRRG